MKALKNIFYLALKELRSLFADPILVVLIIFMFTAMVYSAAGAGADVNNAPVAVVDLDKSTLSYRIRDALKPPFFQVPQEISREEVNEKMNKGDYTFTLEIPPNFEKEVLLGHNPQIHLMIDATAMSQAGLGASYIGRIFENEIQAFFRMNEVSGINTNEPAVSIIRSLFNPNNDSSAFGAVMEVGNTIMIMMLLLVGAAVIREREHGTIEHLLVMPVSAPEIMLSKVLANGIVILAASQLSMWFVVHKSIGVELHGSLLLYMFGSTVFLFSVAALGIMLATIAPSMQQFGLLMIPAYMVMMLFSGSATPRINMPEVAQKISEYWPSTQFASFAQGVLFRGAGLDILWPNLVIMAFTGLIFLGFALIRFKKMLEQQG